MYLTEKISNQNNKRAAKRIETALQNYFDTHTSKYGQDYHIVDGPIKVEVVQAVACPDAPGGYQCEISYTRGSVVNWRTPCLYAMPTEEQANAQLENFYSDEQLILRIQDADSPKEAAWIAS